MSVNASTPKLYSCCSTVQYRVPVRTSLVNSSRVKAEPLLGPVAPSRFSSELDQVGRRELVHDDCALHHF